MQHTEEYKRYMKSPQWAVRRNYIMQKRGQKCEACGSMANLKVHHGTYENFMRESHKDCFVLCQTHHVDLHTQHRKAGRPDLYFFTVMYIKTKRAKRK